MRKTLGLVLTTFGLLLTSLLGASAQDAAVPNAGAIPFHYLTAASTNATNIKNSIGNVYTISAINTSTSLYYLKFYDTATAPACGTPTPVQTYPIPYGASNAGGGIALTFSPGMQFYNGISFCVVGGIADNDTSNAATGVAINVTYK